MILKANISGRIIFLAKYELAEDAILAIIIIIAKKIFKYIVLIFSSSKLSIEYSYIDSLIAVGEREHYIGGTKWVVFKVEPID
jgi:hypothetical protein